MSATSSASNAPHPFQVIRSNSNYLILSSNHQISTFSIESISSNSPTHLATSSPHSALIRLLATHDDYLISTGEDKQLVVSKLPTLEIISKRELVKRANDLVVHVTSGGEVEVVVGDKFGDVYIYPLHAPPPPNPLPKTPIIPTPILGHVSMLNTLCILPSSSAEGQTRIVTGDRDEHVRVSDYPEGWEIEGFCWGSTKFISSLLPLSLPSPLLLSAGGDPTLQIFSSTSYALLHQYPLLDHLLDAVIVNPEAYTSEKWRESHEVREEDERMEKGLAVGALKEVEGEGVLLGASGCTKLLFVPNSLLLPSTSDATDATATATATTIDLGHPILDFEILPSSSSSSSTIICSLDPSRGPGNGRLIHFISLSFSPPTFSHLDLPSESFFSSFSLPSPSPSLSSLYPLLSLLHHPDPAPAEKIAIDQEDRPLKGRGNGKKEKMEERLNSGKRKRGREEAEEKWKEEVERRKKVGEEAE